MRKVKELTIHARYVFAVCEDGTIWRAESWNEGDPVWMKVLAPPEGDGRPEPTIEEVGEKLAKKGRAMIIGRGKKK